MKPEDKNSKLKNSRATTVKIYISLFQFMKCSWFRSVDKHFVLKLQKKKSHPVRSGVRGGHSLFPHAQSTNEGNSCQATHEQEAQNVREMQFFIITPFRNFGYNEIVKHTISKIQRRAFTVQLSVFIYTFIHFELWIISGSVVTERPLFDSR